MKKAYTIFSLVMLTGLALSNLPRFENTTRAQENDQPPRQEIERRESPEQMEMLRNRLAELREAAANAERQGRPEEARELREKAARLAEQPLMPAERAEQRQLREIDKYLERLRQMVREAEEIRKKIGPEIEQRAREMQRPARDLPLRLEPLRPRVQQRMENMQNVIGQIRETFMMHLERIEGTFGVLRNNIERLERENQELRAENERLRNQLRERDQVDRPRDRDVPVQRDVEQPREGREREERPLSEGEK